MANAWDKPARYGNIETRGLSYREDIKTRRARLPNASRYETPSIKR